LYHLITGKPLFEEVVRGKGVSEEDVSEIVTTHLSQVPTSPTAGKEPLLDELVLQLLQKVPDLRYQTGITIYFGTNVKQRDLFMIFGQLATEQLPLIPRL
jgi:hypothetical protein